MSGLPGRLTIFAAACAIGLAALAGPPAAKPLDLQGGSVTYKVVHRLHEVTGTTQKLEGRALLSPDGTVKVQVRAPIASFDSGNSNRDAHMRECTHEAEHPYVTVKGTLAGVQWPLAANLDTTMQAQVELNGQRNPVPVTLHLQPDEGGKLRGTFSFSISLDAFRVERPELLLIKVDDAVRMEGTLTFQESP